MSASFPPALASEMAGIRSTETELVMTDGNMMTDAKRLGSRVTEQAQAAGNHDIFKTGKEC